MIRPLNVFLIDDNEIDLFIHEQFLKVEGLLLDVKKFTYAGDALTFLLKCNEDQYPNLILLDIQMPLMNGFDFLDKFKELNNDIQEQINIVMVSSSLDFGDITRASANSNVVGFLSKPLNIKELITLLEANQIGTI